jgi:hypothetical protein
MPPQADVPLGKCADVAGLYSWQAMRCIATDVLGDVYCTIQKRVGEAVAAEPAEGAAARCPPEGVGGWIDSGIALP